MNTPFHARFGPIRFAALFGVLGVGLAFGGLFGPSGDSPDAKQKTIRQQRDAILREAIAAKPALEASLKKAAGYATFRQTDVNLLLLASGNGYGVLVESPSGKETFLRMASVGGGVGMGVKDNRFLIVFHDPKMMSRFLEQGRQVGAKADAAAKYQDSGAAADQSVKAQIDLKEGTVSAAGASDARAGCSTPCSMRWSWSPTWHRSSRPPGGCIRPTLEQMLGEMDHPS